MTVLHESIVIDRPVEAVFAYVANFVTCAEWDSTAVSSVRLDDGPLGVGSEFDVVCKVGLSKIKLRYQVTVFDAPNKIVLVGVGSLFTVEDVITISPDGDATRLTYTATFTYKFGLGKLAPAIESGLKKMGHASVGVGLKQALEDNYPAPEASRGTRTIDSILPLALWQFTRFGYRRGRKHWNPVSAYMAGQHVLITGATAGLGLSAAMSIAQAGARLTLVVRNPAKGKALVDRIKRETGNSNVSLEIADLCLMEDVTALVDRLLGRGDPIDVLINNAGALFNPRQTTTEKLEKSFALLLLGPYMLTEGLHPLLKAAGQARVINVVSGGLYSQKLEVHKLIAEAKGYSGSVAYARCKRALLVKTRQWAEAWADDGIVVNAMHPGWADTPGVQQALPEFRALTRLVLRSSEEGADTIVWLACATEAGKVSGEFFLDREPRPFHLSANTREDVAEREKLATFLRLQAKPFLLAEAAEAPQLELVE